MASDKSLRALQHAIKQSTPLSSGEIKEAFLRHVMSDPNNRHNQRTSNHLMDIYVELASQVSGNRVPASRAGELFRARYADGYKEVAGVEPEGSMDWPTAVPSLQYYPQELLAELGWIMGFSHAEANQQAKKRGAS